MPLNSPFIGIAIAVHNRKNRTRECLEAIIQNNYQNLFICVVDDGSTDGTWEMLHRSFSHIKAIQGDGNLWWSGATNLAIKACINHGCNYVLLLNPDCIIKHNTIYNLVETAQNIPETVVASVVTDIAHPENIWWAGTIWGPLKRLPFIWLIRHIYKHGESINVLPAHPFDTSDFTGRAVLIPAAIFSAVGLIDEKIFPQYAADNEFGLRVTTKGYRAVVEPNAKSFLYVDETGQNIHGKLKDLPMLFVKRIFYRKHGDVARCWWHLLKRYAPLYAFWPSFFTVGIITSLRIFRLLSTPYQQKCRGNG